MGERSDWEPGSRRVTALDAAWSRSIDEGRLVGAVLLVAERGDLVYERAVGLADREGGQPMTLDTIFRLASLTKPVVTAAVMALVERGYLGLDQPVTTWIPEFRPRTASGARPQITTHHLLTHTAGLSYPGNEEADDLPYHRAGIGDGIRPSGSMSLAENVRRIASVPLDFAPGSSWKYSVATDVLGEVIERVTGDSLSDAVAELVTKPLGMRDTAFLVVDPARLAACYADHEGTPQLMTDPYSLPGDRIVFSPSRALDPAAFPSGGGGLTGSGPNFLRFLEVIRSGGSPVLNRASTTAMMSNQVAGRTVDGPGLGFGYGGAVVVDPAAAGSPHSAGTWYWGGVYGHSWFVDPVQHLSVVLLTNTAYEGMNGQLVNDVRKAIYARPPTRAAAPGTRRWTRSDPPPRGR